VKIYVNRKPVSGPWGGGNKTLQALVETLKKKHEVTYALDDDVDIIYCQDPKPGPDGLWYQDFLNHKMKFGTKIVQRVGDVGTHRGPQITKLVQETATYSDIVIFPSDWSRHAIGFNKTNYFVIHNAPNDSFYAHRDTSLQLKRKDQLRVVTHHWSTNDMKGFEIYEALGKYAKDNDFLDFSYIGRYSDKFEHDGLTLEEPKGAEELAKMLPTNDVYLTASKLEAGANHVLEGLACGLPVLYRSGGGSIDEYCCQYGLQYTNFEELLTVLEHIRNVYAPFKSQVLKYNHKISGVIDTYAEIIGSF
jgi:hypothetical protein